MESITHNVIKVKKSIEKAFFDSQKGRVLQIKTNDNAIDKQFEHLINWRNEVVNEYHNTKNEELLRVYSLLNDNLIELTGLQTFK